MINETTYVSGVSCDKPICEASVAGEELPFSEGTLHYVDLAVTYGGWTVWVGHSTRHYCPAHGPSPGHRMRLARGTLRTPTGKAS